MTTHPPGVIRAPFSEEEVRLLKRHQACPFVHEYTCPCGKKLEVERAGLRCLCGDYVQLWAQTPLSDAHLDALAKQHNAWKSRRKPPPHSP